MRKFQNRAGKLTASPGQGIRSCSLPVIVFHESAQPFVASEGTTMLQAVTGHRHEDHIAFALGWTFLVKMRDVFCEHIPEGALAKEGQPREAFLLDGAHLALRVGVQIRRPWWQGHPLHPSGVNELLQSWAIFPMSLKPRDALRWCGATR